MRGKAMSKVCHQCPWWTQVRGNNPQGGEVDRWDCAMAFLPLLAVETSQAVRGVRAATESTRNELCRRMDTAPPPVIRVEAPELKTINGGLNETERKRLAAD
jgi:hypothetical protein